MRHAIVLAVGLLALGQVAFAAKPAPGGYLNITEVFVDDPNNPATITIMGESLTSGSGPLNVTLGEFGNLTIIGTPSDTMIQASLPADIAPGDYLLTVSTGTRQGQNDEYDLTIGAVGPQGPQGEQGPEGVLPGICT